MSDNKALLERQSFTEDFSCAGLESEIQLAAEAKLVLGYGKLADAMDKAGLPLRRALAKLEIEPYSKESVLRYKAALPKSVSNPNAWGFVQKHEKLCVFILDALCLVFLISFGILGLSGIAGLVWGIAEPSWLADVSIGTYAIGSLVAMVLSLLITGIALHDASKITPVLIPTWKRVDIKGYGEAIPEHVLMAAIAIKKAIPTASILVEHLEYIPDPFLVVANEDEEYYVEVWDEPKFERLPA